MAGLFVIPRFIKKGVAPAQFEGRLYSTLKSAIKYVDYTVVLTANGYVTPFSYYANEYLPTSDVEKYGTPISATLMTSSGQAHPVALTLNSNGKYHYTCVATAAKAVMTVVFLKI